MSTVNMLMLLVMVVNHAVDNHIIIACAYIRYNIIASYIYAQGLVYYSTVRMPERTCFWREYCEMSQGSLFSYFTKVGGSGKPRQSGSTHGEVSKKKPRSAVQSNGSAEMDSDSDGDIGVSKVRQATVF